MRSKKSLWLFLIGLGSQTQFHFVGSIAISELVIFLVAPIIFFIDYSTLKRDGFLVFVWLSIAVCIGEIVASFVNYTPFILMIKGFATPYSVFAIGVVLHRLLRMNLNGLKWLLIGAFISSIICIFVFQPETYVYAGGEKMEGDAAVEMMISHPLFWTQRISTATTLPIQIGYLSVPSIYSITIPIINAVLKILFSHSSGRAAALVAMLSALFIFMGGRRASRMRKLGAKLPMVLLLVVVVSFGLKALYSYAAKTGALGDEALRKYSRQTSSGDSALKILMAGRKEFFIGMIAACDKPIIGYGPKAEDTKGYYESFLSEYGSQEDYDDYWAYKIATAQRGYVYRVIPTHSHIACAWVEDGIFGLLFWLYVLWLMYRYMRYYAAAIPQWFGYFCCVLPSMLWDIFFSPFGGRIGVTLAIVCMLLGKAVFEGRLRLPYNMCLEAQEHE